MNNELREIFKHVTSACRQYRHLRGEGMVYDLHIGLDTTDPWAMGRVLHEHFGHQVSNARSRQDKSDFKAKIRQDDDAKKTYIAGATCRFLDGAGRGRYSRRDPSKVLITVPFTQDAKVRAFLKDIKAFQKK